VVVSVVGPGQQLSTWLADAFLVPA
jgi:hypothetical protein